MKLLLVGVLALAEPAHGFGLGDLGGLGSLLWGPSAGGEGGSRGRMLQSQSNQCTRNCEKRTCNYTETVQMKLCAETCGCGSAGRWKDVDSWPYNVNNDKYWAPKCNLDGKTSTVEIYKGACKANRMIVSGLQYKLANGDYRSGGHFYDSKTPSYCPITPTPTAKYADGKPVGPGIPGTVLKLFGVDYDMYLYFGVPQGEGPGWFISDTPCEFYTFLARLDAEEGTMVSSLIDDSKALINLEFSKFKSAEFHTMMMSRLLQFPRCQHGFEGRCGWRECTYPAKKGHPRCRVSNVPNTPYGFIRMPYNRAVYIRDPAYVPAVAYRSCLGDFNQNRDVEVSELIEVLGAFGVASCSIRSDLDNDCKVGVHDVLITLGSFGKCGIEKKDIPDYQRTKLILSGFTYAGANGMYELQNSSSIAACKAGGSKDISSSDGFFLAADRPVYKRIPSKGEKGGDMYLFGSTPGDGKGKGNSKIFGPKPDQAQVTKSKEAGLKVEYGPSGADPRRWYIGETPCRDSIAYAYMDAGDYSVGKNGQVNVLSVKDTPCPNEVSKGTFWAKPCVWQECSKGQYGWTSCPMYCPPGKNCVGMRKQDHVQVVPDGSSEQGR